MLGERGAVDPSLLDVAKTEIRSLPRLELHREGRRRTVVVRTQSSCARAVDDIRHHAAEDVAERRWRIGIAAVGFDTETKPKYTKGGNSHKVALIQIATHDCAWLFQSSIIGIPACLAALLEDPKILKVGVGVRSDVAAIRTRVASFDDHGSFCDLSDGFRKAFPLLRRLGLRNLSASVLGQNMSKGQQMTNWEKDTLTQPQQAYAANDAYVGLELLGILTGARQVAPHGNGGSGGVDDQKTRQVGGKSASQRVRRVNLSVEIQCNQATLDAEFGAGHGWMPCGCSVNSMPNLISHFMSKNFASRHGSTKKAGRLTMALALAKVETPSAAGQTSASTPSSSNIPGGKRRRLSQQDQNPITTLDQMFPPPNSGGRPRPAYVFRFEGAVCVCDLKVLAGGQVKCMKGVALQGTGRDPSKKRAKRKAAGVVLALM